MHEKSISAELFESKWAQFRRAYEPRLTKVSQNIKRCGAVLETSMAPHSSTKKVEMPRLKQNRVLVFVNSYFCRCLEILIGCIEFEFCV